jgi:thymidylate synthase (FAD)
MLLGHTQLSYEYLNHIDSAFHSQEDGKIIALSAIRTCYSPGTPIDIVNNEGMKYFGKKATDGKGGSEADRLIRHISNSGHTSTLEHISFTFAVEGVSRSLLAQLTRHRHFSFSVQSQRYVKFDSNSKAAGFDYISVPVKSKEEALVTYDKIMKEIQESYDKLRSLGIPAEDARMVLPNGATCNLVLTGNLRSYLEFLGKRGDGTHAQWEIKQFAEEIKSRIIKTEPWTEELFGGK